MNDTHDNESGGVLDMQVIQGLRELGGDDDPGLVLELIEMFLLDAPTRMKEIETSLANGDIKTLERAAHTLKSSCANIGAVKLSGICKEMEARARQKSVEGIPPLYRASVKLLEDVTVALRSIQ